jgi:uroporphyrinogen-III synthase
VSGTVLILRPQPGADETAALARALGLTPVVTPLFEIRPLDWQAPAAARFDAVMLTSANAARHAGPGLQAFLGLPCYAVGEATAAAAQEAGFGRVRAGAADAAALVAMMAGDGIGRALHLCGRERAEPSEGIVQLTRIPVYAAVPTGVLTGDAERALADGAVALLHSPRAAARFAELAGSRRPRIAVAAISDGAAAAAGPGWRAVAAAHRPSDKALLELAAKLCQTDGR